MSDDETLAEILARGERALVLARENGFLDLAEKLERDLRLYRALIALSDKTARKAPPC